jgi:all-trans-retinol 13,14-reductase
MPDKWDVIVVGTGIGGLTAAAMLVQKGLNVLALDRNPHPGGTAYVYTRKGFTFPMGPLGFSTPSAVKETLNKLDGGDLKLSRVQYRIRAFDLEIPLSLPFPMMIKELTRLFPTEGRSIGQFFKDVEAIVSAIQFPEVDPFGGAKPRLLRRGKEAPLRVNPEQARGFRPGSRRVDSNRSILGKVAEKSALEYLSGFVKNWRLRRILGSTGTQEPYSSLPLLSAMWNLISNEGIWYPEGGMRSLCERLAHAVTGRQGNDQGVGEIRLGTVVEEIRVEKNKVLGVTLKDGMKIDSAAVISNADYKTTFLKLIKPKAVPDEWNQAVAHAKQTSSNLQVCLGVDASRVNLSSFKEADRLITRRGQGDSSEEIDWNADEISPEALAGQELEVSLWSKNDRMLGPEGTGIIVIRTEAEYSHFTRFRPAWRKRVPGYQNYKMRLGRTLTQEVENLIPGLEKSILVMDVATPLTFEEQGGRSGGAVASWSWNYEDRPDTRARELVRTPIQGLYMAGYQAFSALFMGGIPTAMESGKRAAKAVLQGDGPVEKIMIPVAG